MSSWRWIRRSAWRAMLGCWGWWLPALGSGEKDQITLQLKTGVALNNLPERGSSIPHESVMIHLSQWRDLEQKTLAPGVYPTFAGGVGVELSVRRFRRY